MPGAVPVDIDLLAWSAIMPSLLGVLAIVLGCNASAQTDARPRADTSVRATSGPIFGAKEDRVRRNLAEGEIERVERGGGGRSVAFEITLDDGTVGYFKPEQTFASHWYAEVASWYVDRALGLGRVPPTVGRRISWARLAPVVADDPHVDEVVVAKDDTVRGSFVWWLPEEPVPILPPRGWQAWISVEDPGPSPYQWMAHWRRDVARGVVHRDPPPPERAELPAELSDMILFDYLIGNWDRWGSNFTNVRTLGRDGPLLFMDNGGAFHAGRKPSRHAKAKLAALQRVRRSTVRAIERLDIDALREQIEADPLAPVLKPRHYADLEQRRREILDHVRQLEEKFGDEAVPW